MQGVILGAGVNQILGGGSLTFISESMATYPNILSLKTWDLHPYTNSLNRDSDHSSPYSDAF